MWAKCIKCIKNEKLIYFVGGIVAATFGIKAAKSNKTRGICVKCIAKGMKFKKDAQEALQNIKEDASDLCFDANQQNKTEE